MNFLLILFFSVVSSASTVEPCSQDSFVQARINEIPINERVPIYNLGNEVVGSLVFNGPSGADLGALFLCGKNPGIFEGRGTTADLIPRGAQPKPLTYRTQVLNLSGAYSSHEVKDILDKKNFATEIHPLFKSDEYFVNGTSSFIERNVAVLNIEVGYRWEESDADWENFQAELIVRIPETRMPQKSRSAL